MSDRGRCHADEQGPCKAPCCPIKDQAAPAWCRPDPHPLCQVDPIAETRADETHAPLPAIQEDPDLPPGVFEIRGTDGKVLGRGNVADIENLPDDGLRFPRVTVAPHVDSAQPSLTDALQQSMPQRMARMLQDRFIADVLLAREAATPEQLATSAADEEQRRAEMAEKVTRWRAESVRARHELAALKYRDAWARLILDHHAPDEHGYCQGCDPGYQCEELPDWPCSTVRLIAGACRIDMPEEWTP